jgi:hypothetical protein
MKKHYLAAILIAAITFVFLTMYGQNNTQVPSNKWDYKAITIFRTQGETAWSQWFETSGDVQNSLPLPVSPIKRVRELGMQGWELVSVTPLSGASGGTGTSGYSDIAGFTTHVTYYLKRQLQ